MVTVQMNSTLGTVRSKSMSLEHLSSLIILPADGSPVDKDFSCWSFSQVIPRGQDICCKIVKSFLFCESEYYLSMM